MKKMLFTLLAVASMSLSGFSQFTEKGYKDLKLGMSIKDASKIVTFQNKDESGAICIYDGVKLNVSFIDGMVYSISTTDKKGKIKGVLSDLIGRSYSEVKSILGNKMEMMQLDEEHDADPYMFIYYIDNASKKDEARSLILYFNEKKVLESISASYNA